MNAPGVSRAVQLGWASGTLGSSTLLGAMGLVVLCYLTEYLGLAPSVADEALPRLAEVVDAVERALERAIPELQAEQRETGSVREPQRRPRKVRAAVQK